MQKVSDDTKMTIAFVVYLIAMVLVLGVELLGGREVSGLAVIEGKQVDQRTSGLVRSPIGHPGHHRLVFTLNGQTYSVRADKGTFHAANVGEQWEVRFKQWGLSGKVHNVTFNRPHG